MVPQSRKPMKKLMTPFQKFAKIEASGGIVLIACTVVALLWSNFFEDSYQAFWHLPVQFGFGEFVLHKTLLHWINDGLMAIFFFVVGLEIKREILVGELGTRKQAILPIAAAIGGMVVPALLYWSLNPSGETTAGWGIPMATDIAFALGILSLVKSDRVPVTLKIFLTAVAIVDDLGAVLVIAIFYTADVSLVALGLGVIPFALLIVANRFGIRTRGVYAVLGFLLWLAFLKSGVHATVAGILAALTIPLNTLINTKQFLEESQHLLGRLDRVTEPQTSVLLTKQQQMFIQALEERCELVESPLQRLEHALHPLVIFGIMPIFALANAGVKLDLEALGAVITAPVFWGIFLGLLVGKQVGILGACAAAVKAEWTMLPKGVTWQHLWGAACLAGIGFTMSLFIAGLALQDLLLTEAKMAILAASLVSATIGLLVLRRAPVVENA
jgi:NhaA family Na+:H+ antiporter